jgi:hypothetical protein
VADHSAIAGVSQTLRTLLRDRMRSPVPVTFVPPDVTPQTFTGDRVNLYLFDVNENAHLKNQEIPGHGHPARYGHPPLSLELSYLLTTHVANESLDDGDLTCQSLLGDAMQTLHDFPLVSEQIEITRASAGTVGDPILHSSLRGEFERVKIMLQPGALEETTRLWSALSNANFRRAVMYRISVVQIESRVPRRSAQPVQTRHFFVTTRRRPEISEAYRAPVTPADVVGDVRVRVGEEITIIGRNFLGIRCWVQLGELEPIRILPDSAGRIHIALPDADYPVDPDHPVTRPIPAAVQIQPGALRVQVLVEHEVESVHGGLDRGVTAQAPRIYRSNVGVVLVVPQITSTSPASGTSAALLTVDGARLYRSDLVSYVLLGDAAIEVRPPGVGDPWAAPTATSVQVSLASLPEQLPPPPPAGRELLVRVQVNDAQNREDVFSFRWMP